MFLDVIETLRNGTVYDAKGKRHSKIPNTPVLRLVLPYCEP